MEFSYKKIKKPYILFLLFLGIVGFDSCSKDNELFNDRFAATENEDVIKSTKIEEGEDSEERDEESQEEPKEDNDSEDNQEGVSEDDQIETEEDKEGDTASEEEELSSSLFCASRSS